MAPSSSSARPGDVLTFHVPKASVLASPDEAVFAIHAQVMEAREGLIQCVRTTPLAIGEFRGAVDRLEGSSCIVRDAASGGERSVPLSIARARQLLRAAESASPPVASPSSASPPPPSAPPASYRAAAPRPSSAPTPRVAPRSPTAKGSGR